jgi:hypothetical protein
MRLGGSQAFVMGLAVHLSWGKLGWQMRRVRGMDHVKDKHLLSSSPSRYPRTYLHSASEMLSN